MQVKEMIRHFVFALVLCNGLSLMAAEQIPAAPARYFNDYARVVSPAVAEQLNAKLEQFERDSSNQLLVVIYPKMESDSSVSDYTVRVAQSWRGGQKNKNNGAVLFAFMQEHQLYLQVGYGLEGSLPDAIAKRIIETEIVPRFRQQDVDGGMKAAVTAMIAATKGEYAGNSGTQNDLRRGRSSRNINIGIVIIFIIISIAFSRRRSQRTYVFGGRRGGWWLGPPGGGSGWNSGGGSGGFSGGGGSFGGGGAGGKW
jgi:uncharacterized protein